MVRRLASAKEVSLATRLDLIEQNQDAEVFNELGTNVSLYL